MSFVKPFKDLFNIPTSLKKSDDFNAVTEKINKYKYLQVKADYRVGRNTTRLSKLSLKIKISFFKL